LVRNDFHSFILKLLNCPNSLIQYLPLFCWVCIFLFKGTKSYQRLSSIVLKKSTMKDVKRLSSEAQTSCLEGFHSTGIQRWPTFHGLVHIAGDFSFWTNCHP
jgi:Zn-dependent M16 (insulinase) family peptidase